MNTPFNPDFQNKNLDAKIVAALERISEVFRVLLWERSKKVKLSPIQIQILIFLKFHELKHCTVNSLAEEFNMTAPTISDAVKVLAEKGLIKKIRSSDDKRFYLLKITSKGEKIIQNSLYFADSLINSVSNLNQNEKEILFSSLINIIADLNLKEILITKRMCFTCIYFQQNNHYFYCNLLEMKLNPKDLRIDCPEHTIKK